MPEIKNTKLNNIIDGTISSLGVSRKDIYSLSRKTEHVNARHIIWWILNRKYKWTLPRVGREFKRNHTTILDAVLKINKSIILGITENSLMIDFKTVLEHLGMSYPEL